ncbi:MAG: hypothetical protein HZA08_07660 [Nitrospirae bacterium]|nr:hypothetical protein [Nitrospirota bacterium]
MHLRKINASTQSYLTIAVLLAILIVVLLLPANGYPQGLNLNGLLAVDYYSTVTSNKTLGQMATGETSGLIQRYSISGSGVVLSPKISSYSANIGLTDSTYKNNPYEGASTKVSRNTLTYSLQMGMIPTLTPINLFAQRNVIGTEGAADLVSDTYSLGWSTTLRTQTSIRLTLLQIGSEYKDPENPRDTRIRIATIGLTQNLSSGFLTTNYQFTDSLVTDKKLGQDTTSNVHSYSIRGETRLSPTLFLSGNATYFPKGSFFTPGVTTTAETTGEIGLLHQTETRLTQAANYVFRKSEGGGTQRDAVTYNMNYNPIGKTDYRTDVAYSSSNSEQSNTNEYRLTGGINHRPFYGLSISSNLVLNQLNVTGITENRMDRVGALAGINYYKLFDLFNMNTNYTADLSYVFSNQSGADGGLITQTASMGLASRNLESAQIITSYTFLLRNNLIIKTENRQEQSVHFEVRSTNTRNLQLQAAANYSNVLKYGDAFVFDSRAEYNLWAGTGTAIGYKFSNFPSATNSQDSQVYMIEAIHQRYFTRRLGMNLIIHGEREELRYTEKNKVTLNTTFNYMIGKITLNLEFREDYTKYPESVYNIQSYFVKASRPF